MMIIWLFDAFNFGEIPWTPNKFANILSIPPRSPIQFLDHHGGDEDEDHGDHGDHGMGDYDDLYILGAECPSVRHKSDDHLSMCVTELSAEGAKLGVRLSQLPNWWPPDDPF